MQTERQGNTKKRRKNADQRISMKRSPVLRRSTTLFHTRRKTSSRKIRRQLPTLTHSKPAPPGRNTIVVKSSSLETTIKPSVLACFQISSSEASLIPISVTWMASDPSSSRRSRASAGGSWLSTRNFTQRVAPRDPFAARHIRSRRECPHAQDMDSPPISPRNLRPRLKGPTRR